MLLSLHALNYSDAPLLAAIHKRSVENLWNEAEFLTLLQNPCYGGWLAVWQDQPIGFILGSFIPPDAEILTFAVLPERRRQSAGKQLLTHFLQECPSSVHTIFLEVDRTNLAAIHLYKKLGFKTVGSRKNYYQHTDGTTTDANVMRFKKI